ncbi:DUF3667 domain-containing protein [Hyphobacterium sp.]|uniref:DUF3667 domain-containing protein n=1 Tax=Hyphobacterium sp. TaxID=2004662 RepID=UPI003BACA11D
MSGDQREPANPSRACANCGAVLTGDFCAVCGQSRKSIERSFPALAGEALGDIFQWDGRFLTTYRQLFARPGRIARDYADGKRQSYTPPVRLYLVISLLFFALLTGSGVRIVAVDISIDDVGDPNAIVSMFQAPREQPPDVIPLDMQDRIIGLAEEEGVAQVFQDLILRAMNAPDAVEQQAAAASGQAMILMVILFALLCAIFHPRRRLIEHAIHALYFHAAILIPLGVVMVIGIFVPMSMEFAIATAIASLLAFLTAIVLFDRGFYASSWVGAVLRAIPLFAGYVVSAAIVAIGLTLFAAL